MKKECLGSDEIFMECSSLYKPNSGISALAHQARENPEFCIIELGIEKSFSFRSVCSSKCECKDPEFMLACVQTRKLINGVELSENAIRIYNSAIINTAGW